MLGLNGVQLPIPLADAEDMVAVLVAARRAVPYRLWCLEPADVELAALDRLF